MVKVPGKNKGTYRENKKYQLHMRYKFISTKQNTRYI